MMMSSREVWLPKALLKRSIPMTNMLPAFAMFTTGLALVERDGRFILAGVALGLASIVLIGVPFWASSRSLEEPPERAKALLNASESKARWPRAVRSEGSHEHSNSNQPKHRSARKSACRFQTKGFIRSPSWEH